jgi:CheY-like chemotaxis protein
LSRAGNILVVEDEESLRLLLQRVLEQAGFAVATADNGLTALQSIDLVPPDLVICDINMPELDGLQMVEGLRSHPETQSLPVIFLTASESPGDLVKSVGLKARHYLSKPFSNDKLVEKVRGILGA